jgi:hypothetical protein
MAHAAGAEDLDDTLRFRRVMWLRATCEHGTQSESTDATGSGLEELTA